jgi:actin-related protein 5
MNSVNSYSLPLISCQRLFTREQSIRNVLPTKIENIAEGTPLIIDNGSHTLRVGWNTHANPTMECEVEWLLCTHLRVPIRHADRIPRAHSGPITYHWTHFELMMDECLDRFIGPHASSVPHPILMTEPVSVPHYTRTRMTELWFEAYRVPSICFGVDALYSFYYHRHHPLTAAPRESEVKTSESHPQQSLGGNTLIISAAHSATHLLPLQNGEWLPHLSLRLDVAGAHSTEYLQRLLHLKYPLYRALLSREAVQHLKHTLCYTAPHYTDELMRYVVPSSTSFESTEHVPTFGPLLVQLPTTGPFASVVANAIEDASESTRKEHVRNERAARMRELSQRRRAHNIEERIARWHRLLQLLETMNTDIAAFEEGLHREGLATKLDVERTLVDIYRYLRHRSVNVHIPPTLTSLFRGHESELTKNDPDSNRPNTNQTVDTTVFKSTEVSREEWLSGLRERFRALATRLLPLRQSLPTGRTSRDQRLKFATAIEKSTAPNSQRHSSRRGTKGEEVGDDFGARDEDWDIYLQASRVMDGVDSEELSELRELYVTLQEHDPNYLQHLSHDVDLTPLTTSTAASPSSPSSVVAATTNSINQLFSDSIRQDHHLYIGTERIRVSEVVWQPSMLGSTQMGLTEAINYLLHRLPHTTCQVFSPLRVFLTGGHTLLRGFALRLFNELYAILPSAEGGDTVIIDEGERVYYSAPSLIIERATDPLRNAWRGAQCWTNSSPEALSSASLYRHQYEEHGAERLHMLTPRHFASNPPLPPFITL